MALYNPYCTTVDVTTHTKNSDLGTALLERVVNQASRFIEDYTKRLYHYYDYNLVGYSVPSYDYLMGAMIYLPFPVLSITKITLDGNDIDLSACEYATKPSHYKMRSEIKIGEVASTDFLGQTVKYNQGKVVVFGDFGYTALSSADVPDDLDFPPGIRRAATLIASVFSEQKRVEELALDGTRTSIAEYTIPKEVYDILNMHKRKALV